MASFAYGPTILNPQLAACDNAICHFAGGMFVGFLLGKNAARHGEQESGAADSAVKGAVAGLAALLLAFSFSLAAGRYDQRNTLVVSEANRLVS